MNKEELPNMKLSVGSEEIDATPENTSLFTFIGQLAMYNHIFVVTEADRERNRATGMYIFPNHGVFDDMKNFMIENDYPLHLNGRQVAECDLNAYQLNVEQVAASESANIDDELNKLLDDGTA